MPFSQHCAFNCKLHLILPVLALSRASFRAPLAALRGRRALQIRGLLLQIAAPDAFFAALRFKLQAVPDSGSVGFVSGLFWSSVGGSPGAPCLADSRLTAANRCQDAFCAALRFRLQTAPDSGNFGVV